MLKVFSQLKILQLSRILDVYIIISFLDTVVNTVTNTVDTTKNVAASAVDKGAAFVGSAKGICTNLHWLVVEYLLLIFFLLILNTVVNTVHSTVDTTKNVAASAVDKGAAIVGSAKGI